MQTITPAIPYTGLEKNIAYNLRHKNFDSYLNFRNPEDLVRKYLQHKQIRQVRYRSYSKLDAIANRIEP